MIVEVKLLNYTFRFKKLTWREEFTIKFPVGKDQKRVYLAHALVEISGSKLTSFAEATRVVDSLPTAISSRVFRIYKGQFPPNRRFATASLFKAPEPNKYNVILEKDEEDRDKLADQARIRLESQFGRKELDQAAEIDRKILGASGLRGAIKVDADHAD